jgi:hypothetical protein
MKKIKEKVKGLLKKIKTWVKTQKLRIEFNFLILSVKRKERKVKKLAVKKDSNQEDMLRISILNREISSSILYFKFKLTYTLHLTQIAEIFGRSCMSYDEYHNWLSSRNLGGEIPIYRVGLEKKKEKTPSKKQMEVVLKETERMLDRKDIYCNNDSEPKNFNFLDNLYSKESYDKLQNLMAKHNKKHTIREYQKHSGGFVDPFICSDYNFAVLHYFEKWKKSPTPKNKRVLKEFYNLFSIKEKSYLLPFDLNKTIHKNLTEIKAPKVSKKVTKKVTKKSKKK